MHFVERYRSQPAALGARQEAGDIDFIIEDKAKLFAEMLARNKVGTFVINHAFIYNENYYTKDTAPEEMYQLHYVQKKFLSTFLAKCKKHDIKIAITFNAATGIDETAKQQQQNFLRQDLFGNQDQIHENFLGVFEYITTEKSEVAAIEKALKPQENKRVFLWRHGTHLKNVEKEIATKAKSENPTENLTLCNGQNTEFDSPEFDGFRLINDMEFVSKVTSRLYKESQKTSAQPSPTPATIKKRYAPVNTKLSAIENSH